VGIGGQRFAVSLIPILHNDNRSQIRYRCIDRMTTAEHDDGLWLQSPKIILIALGWGLLSVEKSQPVGRKCRFQSLLEALKVAPIGHHNNRGLPP
jgi:hypothetical protein